MNIFEKTIATETKLGIMIEILLTLWEKNAKLAILKFAVIYFST